MKIREHGAQDSELEKIIAPEIKHDALYELIEKLSATEPLKYVLEISSSAQHRGAAVGNTLADCPSSDISPPE